MNGDRYSDAAVGKYVVAAINTADHPTLGLQYRDDLPAVHGTNGISGMIYMQCPVSPLSWASLTIYDKAPLCEFLNITVSSAATRPSGDLCKAESITQIADLAGCRLQQIGRAHV